MLPNKYFSDPLPKLKLDKNRRRVKQCPCGKSNRDGKFVPYVNHNDKGYCHACGKTFLPELPKRDTVTPWLTLARQKGGNHVPKAQYTRTTLREPRPNVPFRYGQAQGDSRCCHAEAPEAQPSNHISTIDPKIFLDSLQHYAHNNFVQYLYKLFPAHIVGKLLGMYPIGTSKHWPGATVFWQLTKDHQVRTGKIMLYNPLTGKRVKDKANAITWVHKVLCHGEPARTEKVRSGGAHEPCSNTFNLKQCLFGEYNLHVYPHKPIALVESEKTAIIASAYLPQCVWLATGGIQNFNAELCAVLKGRTVLLYPDLNRGYEAWVTRARELKHLCRFKIARLLQDNATPADKEQGLDLADYLTRYTLKEFGISDDPLPVKPIENELRIRNEERGLPAV